MVILVGKSAVNAVTEAIGEQRLSIATFGSAQENIQACPVVKVGMRVRECTPMHLSLYVVPMIWEPLVSQSLSVCVSEYPQIPSIDLADESGGTSMLKVDMLIGSDYYWEIVTGGVSHGAQGPTVIHTKLGWVISGPAPLVNSKQSATNLVSTHLLRIDAQLDSLENLGNQLQSFWDLESLGIIQPERTLFVEFCSTVAIKNGHYEVTLLWKEYHKTSRQLHV